MRKISNCLSVVGMLLAVGLGVGCALEGNASGGGTDAGIDSGQQATDAGTDRGDEMVSGGDSGTDAGTVCQDECRADERECRPGGYRFCGDFDLDDCLEWSDVFPCEAGEVCQEGICSPSCADTCTAGERRCQGAGIERCADGDGDGCLDWEPEVECAADESCDAATLQCRRSYPQGPYGTRYGDTMENHCFEVCQCSGGQPQAETLCLQDLLGAKAVLFTVHTGWCPSCAEQAAGLEPDFYRPYHDLGLEIVLMYFEDEYRSSQRGDLLRLCCDERQAYGMTFAVAIDPGAQIVERYFSGFNAQIPLNMVLDGDMVIRYQLEGYTWGLETTIRELLGL